MKVQSIRFLRPLIIQKKFRIIIAQDRLCHNPPFSKIYKLTHSLSLKSNFSFKKTLRKPSLALGNEAFKVAVQNISIKYILNLTVQNSIVAILQSIFPNRPNQIQKVKITSNSK